MKRGYGVIIVISILTTSFRSIFADDRPMGTQEIPSGRGARTKVLAIPDIEVVPSQQDVGHVTTGASTAFGIKVYNQGEFDLDVTETTIIGPDVNDFTVSSGQAPFSVNPNDSKFIVLRFDPGSAGPKAATLRILSNDPDEGQVDVHLTGTAVPNPEPDIVCDEEIEMGSVLVNDFGLNTVEVKNRGNSDLIVTATMITGSEAMDFSIDNGGAPFTVGSGEAHEITVDFHPTHQGARNATLSVSSNDPDESPFAIAMTGSGVQTPTPDISVKPQSQDWGSVLVGGQRTQTVTMHNNGNAVLNVNVPIIAGPDQNDYNITYGDFACTIQPGASRNIDVQFKPAAAGSKSATLVINTDDPDESPSQVSLTGQGVNIPTPDVATNQNEVNYGEVGITSSMSQTIEVTNRGNSDLTVTSVNIEGSDQNDFSFTHTQPAAPYPLASGSSQSIAVSFRPSAEGAKSATLSIASNDPDENPMEVVLKGSGVQSLAEIEITPPAASLQIGEQQTFTAEGKDFSGNPIEIPNPVWTTTGGGTIASNGSQCTYTAAEAGDYEINCQDASTSVQASAQIRVTGIPELTLSGTGETIPMCPCDSNEVTILPFSIKVDQLDSWIIGSISFQASGTGNEAEHIQTVRLYEGENIISSAKYTEDNGRVAFNINRQLGSGEKIDLQLKYEFITEGCPTDTTLTYYIETRVDWLVAQAETYTEQLKLPPTPLFGGPIIVGPVWNENTSEIFSSIQRAIDDGGTQNGHTILVCPGTYSENVDVNKELTVQSMKGKEVTTVNALNQNDHVITLTRRMTSIDGFTIKGAKSQDKAGISISVDSLGGMNIKNNTITENFDGIFCENQTANSSLKKPSVKNMDTSLRLEKNLIHNNLNHGIRYEGDVHMRGKQNRVDSNGKNGLSNDSGSIYIWDEIETVNNRGWGIRVNGGLWIDEGTIVNNGLGGIKSDNYGTITGFDVNISYNGGPGVSAITSANEASFTRAKILYNKGPGVEVSGDFSVSGEGNQISHNEGSAIITRGENVEGDVTLENIKISHNKGRAIDAQGNVYIDNGQIDNNTEGGIYSELGSQIFCRDLINIVNGGHGIHFQSASTDINLTNSKITSNSGPGIEATGDLNIEGYDNWIQHNKGAGIILYRNPSSYAFGNIDADNFRIENNTGWGIDADGSVIISNGIVRNNSEGGISTRYGNQLFCRDIEIAGNQGHGISARTNNTHVDLHRTKIFSNKGPGIEACGKVIVTGTNNEIADNDGSGIITYRNVEYDAWGRVEVKNLNISKNQGLGINAAGNIWMEQVNINENITGGLSIQYGDDIFGMDLEITQNGGIGIDAVVQNTDVTLINTKISDNQGHAIEMRGELSITGADNQITGNAGEGIRVYGDKNSGNLNVQNIVVVNNNGWGILGDGKIEILDGVLHYNASGGIRSDYSTEIVGTNLILSENFGPGIDASISPGSNIKLYSAIIRDNKSHGINVQGNLLIGGINNQIINNFSCGIQVLEGDLTSEGNLLIKNNSNAGIWMIASNLDGNSLKIEKNGMNGITAVDSHIKLLRGKIDGNIGYGLDLSRTTHRLDLVDIRNNTEGGINSKDTNQGLTKQYQRLLDDAGENGARASSIVMSSITNNSGNALTYNTIESITLYHNNVQGNSGIGLENQNSELSITAQNNWWGDASGPGGDGPGVGDEVMGNIDFANWFSEPVSLVMSVDTDTLCVPSGGSDSVFCVFQNWTNPDDVIDVTISSDSIGWLSDNPVFSVPLIDSLGSSQRIQFEMPVNTQVNTSSKFYITATSQAEPTASWQDSLIVTSYLRYLSGIDISPSENILRAGQSRQFSVTGFDSVGNTMNTDVIWTATGGQVDESGYYTAGPDTGMFYVKAEDSLNGHQDSTAIRILPELVRIQIIPDSVTISLNELIKFNVKGYDSQDSLVNVITIWGSTGGQIDQTGLFLATSDTGRYQIFVEDSVNHVRAHADVNVTPSTFVADEGRNLESVRFSLGQNYPNPFNPETLIPFSVKERCHVRLVVYDIRGREIKRLVDETRQPGFYTARFDAGQLSTGLYIYSIQMKDFRDVKKMVLME